MGLDSVELVMKVEESFGLSIPDGDAADLDTVGKLHDYILAHRSPVEQGDCLSSVAFYKVRRALMSELTLPRASVHPSTPLSAIIPMQRRRTWLGLKRAIGLRFPELVRPAWVERLGVAMAVGVLLASIMWLIPRLGIVHGALLAIGTTLAAGCGFYWLTVPLATQFPSESATVGGLAKAILARNYGVISDECGRSNAQEVWESLQAIIVEQMGVRQDEVTRESNFVKDLGLS